MSQRIQLKMLLTDVIRNATRNELCELLAVLLSHEALVRGILGNVPDSFSLYNNAKEAACEVLEDDLDDEADGL